MDTEAATATFLAFDFSCRGRVHAPFNAGVLATLRAGAPRARMICYADPSHAAAIQETGLVDSDLRFEAPPMLPPASAGKPGLMEQDDHADACFDFLLEQCRQHQPTLAIILCATPELCAQVRRRWKQHHGRLDLVFHAHLAEIGRWRSRNPLRRWRDMESEMARPGAVGVRYVVLEEAVLRNLCDRFPARRRDALVLPHPIGSTAAPARVRSPGEPLRVGFLGWANSEKGYDLFVRLAERHASPELGFHAIGSTSAALGRDAAVLSTPPASAPLSYDAYRRGIASLDLVCLPLERHRYSWSASGSLVDCIDFRVPVLVSRTDVVEDLFARYGALGIICDGEEQFDEVFRRHAPGDLAALLPGFGEALRRARADRLPKALAGRYPAL